jgi:hypothetical protein
MIEMQKERSWTDEDLRDAVARSRSYREVLRSLGLQYGSFGYLQRVINELRISTAHFRKHPRKRKRLCADDQLRALIPKSKTLSEVVEAIGAKKHSNTFYKLRRHIAELGLDTSHMERLPRGRERTRRWSNDELRNAVAESRSLTQAIRRLGLVPAGGNFEHVRREIQSLKLDTSHFTGQGWNVGGQFVPNPALPLDQVLVAGRYTSTYNLKQRLFRAGLKKPACELCGWCERAPDGRIPVELDHINGDRNDNRLENLRVLCPNCHSLQPTHRGLNKKSVRRPASECAEEGLVWLC